MPGAKEQCFRVTSVFDSKVQGLSPRRDQREEESPLGVTVGAGVFEEGAGICWRVLHNVLLDIVVL